MQSAFDIPADLDTPVSAYLKLAPFEPRFLLESVVGRKPTRAILLHRFRECQHLTALGPGTPDERASREGTPRSRRFA